MQIEIDQKMAYIILDAIGMAEEEGWYSTSFDEDGNDLYCYDEKVLILETLKQQLNKIIKTYPVASD